MKKKAALPGLGRHKRGGLMWNALPVADLGGREPEIRLARSGLDLPHLPQDITFLQGDQRLFDRLFM